VLGGLLAICSAATFAFNNASVRRGVLTGTVAQAMAITVPIGVPLFFLAALITGRLGDALTFSTQGYVALALAGILHFVWGRYCNYRATRAIGTNLVAPIQQFNLLVTLMLAIWLAAKVWATPDTVICPLLSPMLMLLAALSPMTPSTPLSSVAVTAACRCLRRPAHTIWCSTTHAMTCQDLRAPSTS